MTARPPAPLRLVVAVGVLDLVGDDAIPREALALGPGTDHISTGGTR